MRIILIFLSISACSSAAHKRELLQSQNPDCFVEKSLEIVCPDPFTDADRAIDYLEKKQKRGKR